MGWLKTQSVKVTQLFLMCQKVAHTKDERGTTVHRAAYWIVITEEMNHLHIYEEEKYSGDLRRDNQDLKII